MFEHLLKQLKFNIHMTTSRGGGPLFKEVEFFRKLKSLTPRWEEEHAKTKGNVTSVYKIYSS